MAFTKIAFAVAGVGLLIAGCNGDGADSTAATSTASATTGAGATGAGGGTGGSGGVDDPVPPTAALVFPVAVGPSLPSGTAFPVIAAGSDDQGVALVEVLVDGQPQGSGPGTETLWRSDMGMTGAGAISQESLTGDGYVEFTVPGTRTQKVIGLGGPDMGATDTDVEFWLYFTPVGNLSGNLGGGTYAPGDVFRIELSGGMLRSTKNGTDLNMVAAPQTPLFLDTWLASPGAAVSDAKIAMGTRAPMPVTWANPIGVSEGLTFTHVWDSTSVEDGAHTFTARVTDVGGNVVESSALMKTVDNTLPTCTLDSPSQGATVSGNVQVTGTATDANLFTLAFFVDSTLLSQHDGQTQASTMWDTTTIANGTHTVRSQSYDHGGGTSLPCEVTVTVNN